MKLTFTTSYLLLLTGIFSAYAHSETKNCNSYSTTEICTQDKHGATEFLEIRAGNGTTLGDPSNHFTINGEGYSIYNPQKNFRVQLVSGIVNYMDVHKSYFIISGTENSGITVSYAKADNTYLDDSVMWVMTNADHTTAKGKSIVMVTTQFANDDHLYYQTNNDGTIWYSPVIDNSRYYDESQEILWGVKITSKGWDTVATSNNSTFYKNSEQLISGNGRSYNANFYENSYQMISTNGEASGAASDSTFHDDSKQYLYSNTEAINTTLNNNSVSTVYNSAKQTGTTTVNNEAQLILTTGSEDITATDSGAYAEKVVLKSQDSKLVIDSGSAGKTAFADAIEGSGSVLLTSKTHNYSNLVTDNVSGNQSYYFATDIKNKKSSILTINTSSAGEHTVFVENDGAQDTNGTEKKLLIMDKSGANAKATFTSDGEGVELGGYLYTVNRDGNTNNWYLTGKPKPSTDNPGTDNPGTVSPTAKTITGLASTSYLMNQAEMATLRQRMGDLTRANKTTPGDVSGAWGRMYGGNYKTRNNDNLAKADMNYYGFQLGGDVNTVHYSDNTNYLGVFMGHTTGKPDYDSGNATATSWYGGVYDTFIMDDGFYVDSALKLGQYRNKYNLKDSQSNAVNGKAHSSVITLSSQAGKRFTLTEADNYNVYAEPQAQLTYSRVGAFNTKASNDLRVKQASYNSTVARLGMLLGTQINKQSDIYLKTSYLHEFSKDVNYKLNNSPESYSVKGNGLEAGLGVNVKLKDNGYLYAEADYINSKAHYTGSKFNIGYRYSF